MDEEAGIQKGEAALLGHSQCPEQPPAYTEVGSLSKPALNMVRQGVHLLCIFRILHKKPLPSEASIYPCYVLVEHSTPV